MMIPAAPGSAASSASGNHRPADDAPMQRLLQALPAPVRRVVAWLRQPGRLWVRAPLAALFIFGGFLGFLPILGFWMLPIGLLLLSEDLPFLRRPVMQALGAVQGWIDRRRGCA